ncbi:MAG: hypothetical protein LLG01_12990 [Planctomycetaceae bacterium]|nr:hypothetical protein [Planctomycetaceae bacterium]
MSAISASKDSHPEKVARLEAQVQALTNQLRHAQRLATIGTVAAMVAHEFNNILTPILNYATLAKKNPALTDKALSHAASGGARAAEICQAILGISGTGAAEASHVNVRQAVQDVLAAMARDPAKDRIELAVEIPEGLTALARPVELHQVLLNLLMNARTALLGCKGPRRIEIKAAARGRQTVVQVSDNGPGIAAENLPQIFEPFFTTGQRPDGSQGNGLGLAVCREIVTAAGGTIQAQSTPGAGASFTLTLNQ